MADADLTGLQPASPLDTLALPTIAGVASLGRASIAARYVLRLNPGAISSIDPEMRTWLSGRVNSATRLSRADWHALRLGPDEWLLLDLAARNTADTTGFAAALSAVPYSLVDVTDRQVALVVSGPAAVDVLAAGCALSLGGSAFPENKATRTLVGKAEVVMWRTGIDRFHLEVARSFAPYLVQFLAEVIGNEAAIAKLQNRPTA